MSCRGGCGSKLNNSSSRRQNTSGEAGSPSHRTVHVSMERSPTRPIPEAFGNAYADYAAYGNIRIPPTARASTPGAYGYPSQHETFGSQIDYNLSWMPKDINLSELLDQSGPQVSSRFRRMDQNITHTPSQLISPETTPSDPKSLLGGQQAHHETSPQAKKADEERTESLMEWFDKSVEKELKKHKETAIGGLGYSPPAPTTLPNLNLSRGMLERMAEASASQVEICCQMRKEPDSELADAVDKLAKAEAMCNFAGAVKAAEAAAEAAPPELAEEAAVASARGFQTEVTTTSVNQDIEGIRPMEVVGYIGVTKPKYPMKRK